jgi:hypothetical protein
MKAESFTSRAIRPLALAAVLAAGLAPAGCGSSSNNTALSKPEFVVKANAICAEGNNKVESVEKSLGSKPSPAQLSTFVTGTLVPSIQGQIDGVRALAAPSGGQTTITHMLDVAQEDLNKAKSDPALLASGQNPFASFAALAHRYGLTECAPTA